MQVCVQGEFKRRVRFDKVRTAGAAAAARSCTRSRGGGTIFSVVREEILKVRPTRPSSRLSTGAQRTGVLQAAAAACAARRQLGVRPRQVQAARDIPERLLRPEPVRRVASRRVASRRVSSRRVSSRLVSSRLVSSHLVSSRPSSRVGSSSRHDALYRRLVSFRPSRAARRWSSRVFFVFVTTRLRETVLRDGFAPTPREVAARRVCVPWVEPPGLSNGPPHAPPAQRNSGRREPTAARPTRYISARDRD